MGAFSFPILPPKRAIIGAFFIVFDSLQQHKNKRQNNAIDALLYPYQYMPIT